METRVSLGRGRFWISKPFRTLSLSLLTVAFSIAALAPAAKAQTCALACSGAQISLDENCEAEVTVAMIADTSQCPNGEFVVYVIEVGGDTIPTSPFVNGYNIGMNLYASVYDVNSGQSCWAPITVEDKLPPQITCNCPPVMDPAEAEPECIVNCLDAIGDTEPDLVDNCSDAQIILINETIMPICDPQFIRKLTRKYVAVDEAGNMSDTCEQVFFLERIDFSLIEWPDSLTILGGNPVLCDDDFLDLNNDMIPDPAPIGQGGAGVPTIDGIPIYPNFINACNAQIFVEDVLIGPIGCTKKIMRMWTAFEWHCQGENDTLYIQLIEITDEEGPTIYCPDDITVSTGITDCDAMVYIPVPMTEDNCNDVIQISAAYPGGFASNILETNGVYVELPVGDNVITYTAYDECFNSTTCEWVVTVEDNTPPIPICDHHTVVSLTNDGPEGLTLVPAHAFDDGSYDECGPVTFLVRRMNSCINFDWTTGGAFVDETPDGYITSDDLGTAFRPGVPFACCDVGAGPIMVVLRVEDPSGNINTCMVEITVQDKIGPFIECPPDITISCDYDYDMTELDIFGTVVLDEEDREEICLFDPANPDADIEGFTCWGLDGFAYDNCDVVVEEFVFTELDDCGQGYIRRQFRATDPGGRTEVCNQYIYVVNFDPFNPQTDVYWPPDIEIVGCGADTDPENTGFPIITEDECDLIGLTYDDQIFPFVQGACFKILRTWQIIDWCQFPDYGPWEYLQVIKVIDNEAPEFTTSQPDLSVCNEFDCGPQFIELIQEAEDDCTPDQELEWSYGVDEDNDGDIDYGSSGVGPVINASGDYPIGSHRIVYTFEDKCGNKTTREQLFDILGCKPPTPICFNGLSADLMPVDTDGDGEADWGMITLWASDFDKGSLHDCGYPVTVSFSPDTTYKSRVFDCTDVGEPVEVELWVTDLVLGEQAYCTTYIIIQDNMEVCPDDPEETGIISGEIETETTDKINAVNVALDGSAMNPVNTNGSGQYSFPPMPMGGTYKVMPQKNDDWTNGVTTLDLIGIQKHLLGMQYLTSPYKMIAADANNSGSISAIDLVTLRKLILGVTTDIPENKSWRFIPSGYEFNDPANPFGEQFPEFYEVSGLAGSMDVNFLGIKVGDVNNTVQANFGTEDDNTPIGLTMLVQDRDVKAGEVIELTFDASEADDLLGYQFTLNFDPEVLQYEGYRSGTVRLDDQHFGTHMTRMGMLTTSWSEAEGVRVTKGDELFTLVFRAKTDGVLKDNIWIGSEITRAESYDTRGTVRDVKVEFAGSVQESTEEFALIQNRPNPFSDNTTISFTLPYDDEAVLTVYDVSGKVMYVQNVQAVAGYNELEVSASALNATGVMYYNVTTSEFSATRKMVLVK